MERGNRRVFVLAACAAMLFVVASKAPDPIAVLAAAPSRVTILGAHVDRVAGTLTIHGRDLGGAAAEVALGGVPLEVSSASEDTIVATLPAGAVSGSLLLTVTNGNRADGFAVNIPASAIVAPDGITIQSTEAGVQILAGGSSIVLEATGAIRIESSGPLQVRTPGALDLRGNSVSIRSDTSMALSAGSTLDVNGAAITNIRGGAQVAVTGGIIKLN